MKWFGYADEPLEDRPPAAQDPDDEVDISGYAGLPCGMGGDPLFEGDRGYLMPMLGPRGAILMPTHEECLLMHLGSPSRTLTHEDG